jgi:biotin carboxylase
LVFVPPLGKDRAVRALLLVPRGSRLTGFLVGFLREMGFEPFVLSTALGDGADAFTRACADLGVEHAVSDSVALSAGELLDRVAALPGCAFCFTVADGLRHAMAVANQAIGARDISPDAALGTLDKHLMRRRLAEHGLTTLSPFKLSDPDLRSRLDRGEKHIVKPRRGAASLCTRSVTSWDEVVAAVTEFERGTDAGDQWGEFYRDNELVAETFFEGSELSFEVLRQDGRTVLAVEHEKPVLEFTDRTVLERGFASPAVRLTPGQLRAARECAESGLAALELDQGCYHVEIRVDETDACELVEINPRVGGGFLYDSVKLQYGRSLGHEWVDLLVGRRLPAETGDRRCGTYLQNLYPEPGRPVLDMVPDPQLPEPVQFSRIFEPGRAARADRADRAAMAIWRTDLATHAETVALLAARDYVSFVYAEPVRC